MDHSADIGEIGPNKLELRFIHAGDRAFLSRVDAFVKGQVLSVLVKDVSMRRSSESEHSKQLSFLNALTFLHVVHNARNLNHTDLDDSHSSDLGVISLDHIDLSHRTHGEKRLGCDIAIGKLDGKTGIASIISIADLVASFNDSTDWRSPSVVTPRIQETLVDSSILKSVSEVGLLFGFEAISSENLSKRISSVLQPELIMPLDISLGHIEIRIVF